MTKTIYTLSDENSTISYKREKKAIKEFKKALKRCDVKDFMIKELVNVYKQEHYVEYQIHTEYKGEIFDSLFRFEQTLLAR